ncbi:MAG: hypothetical protein HW421_2512 [Ignavibacteria bacterium]|nr:hypothetical protein [Ignavibacteria bacterium]
MVSVKMKKKLNIKDNTRNEGRFVFRKLKKTIPALFIVFCLCGIIKAQSPPLLPPDWGDGTPSYILWSWGFHSGADSMSKAPGLRLYGAALTGLSYPIKFLSLDVAKWSVQGVRVLDNINYGDSLKNTIFPVPVVRVAEPGRRLDGFKYSEPIDFHSVDLDSIATKQVILRNTGHSKLNIPMSEFYSSSSRAFTGVTTTTLAYIQRSDQVQANEVKWQIRDTEAAPRPGDTLVNTTRDKDTIIAALNPGDTISFYIDALPRIVGRKVDSLVFERMDGLDKSSYSIPIKLLSTWTMFYDFGSNNVRAATPSYSGDFIDTIRISNNKGNRTRITSMRLAMTFNKYNLFIKDFEFDSTAFPAGWKFRIDSLSKNEKNGLVLVEAWADTNYLLKQGTISSEDLSYFVNGNADTAIVIGRIKGMQLLGTSDSTEMNIDTSRSQHNFSTDYLAVRDSALKTDKIPYIRTIRGVIISDSLAFLKHRLLAGPTMSALIENVYPNPVGDNSNLSVELSANTEITASLKIYETLTGAEIKNIFDNKKLKNGKESVSFNVKDLNSGNYFIVLKSANGSDIWMLNVIK